MKTNTNEITNKAVRNIVRPWLTGNDEADAKNLSRTFRTPRFSLSQWRQVVFESKSA